MWFLAASVAGLAVIGMVLAFGLYAINPTDPMLRDEKPWACTLCRRAYPNQTAFLTHRCPCAVTR